jgi:hypothetical protein
MKIKQFNVKVKPLIIVQLLRPNKGFMTSSFAMNVQWDEDEKNLNYFKRKFTLFVNKISKKQEQSVDKTKGGLFLHVVIPPLFMNKYITNSIKMKKYTIKHWKLDEVLWRLSLEELANLKVHYQILDGLIVDSIKLFHRITTERCNRVPATHHIIGVIQLERILLNELKDYEVYVCPNLEKTTQIGKIYPTAKVTREVKIKINPPEFEKAKVEDVKSNIHKIKNENIEKKKNQIIQNRKMRKKRNIFYLNSRPLLKKSNRRYRISLVKVIGEYWGWDTYYTQFRIKRSTTPLSKTEVVIKEIDSIKKSIIKHLVWCFRENKLWFESINSVSGILKVLV